MKQVRNAKQEFSPLRKATRAKQKFKSSKVSYQIHFLTHVKEILNFKQLVWADPTTRNSSNVSLNTLTKQYANLKESRSTLKV